MTSSPSLSRALMPDPRHPRAVVLLLHGGAAQSEAPVTDRSLSWRRARWMMQTIAPRATRDDVALRLLRFSVRGWNGSGHQAVADARWALQQVREEVADVPIVLLGHSMGARTAVQVADDPGVRGVVALAPWLSPGDPVRGLAGKRLYAAHGRRDRITSYRQTAAYVDRARQVAEHAEVTSMGPVGHYMLHRVSAWNRFAWRSAQAVLG